jgi:hypothetical protein
MGAHDHDAIKHCLGQTCLLIFLSLGYILIRPNMELGPIFQIALITLRYTIDGHRAIDVNPERHRIRHHHFFNVTNHIGFKQYITQIADIGNRRVRRPGWDSLPQSLKPTICIFDWIAATSA